MTINKTQVKEKLADINIILNFKKLSRKKEGVLAAISPDLVAAKSPPTQPIFLPVVC